MNALSKLESGPIRAAALNNWGWILNRLAPELEPAMKKPGKLHIPCPRHQSKRDGFRYFRDAEVTGGGICNFCGAKPDGFALLRWLREWTFPEALAAVNETLNGVTLTVRPVASVASRPPPAVQDALIRARLRDTWGDALHWRAPAARPLRDYLRHRGIDVAILTHSEDVFRFHPALSYWEEEEERHVGRLPAMLALVRDRNGKPVTIHRTYLTQDGRKADVGQPKKLMPVPSDRQVLGGAIRLFPRTGPLLGTCEGIETALAIRQMTGLTMWPALSTQIMAGFEPPDDVERMVICADLDRNGAGIQAASTLHSRMETAGKASLILLPEMDLEDRDGIDWLDVMALQGRSGFEGFRQEVWGEVPWA